MTTSRPRRFSSRRAGGSWRRAHLGDPADHAPGLEPRMQRRDERQLLSADRARRGRRADAERLRRAAHPDRPVTLLHLVAAAAAQVPAYEAGGMEPRSWYLAIGAANDLGRTEVAVSVGLRAPESHYQRLLSDQPAPVRVAPTMRGTPRARPRRHLPSSAAASASKGAAGSLTCHWTCRFWSATARRWPVARASTGMRRRDERQLIPGQWRRGHGAPQRPRGHAIRLDRARAEATIPTGFPSVCVHNDDSSHDDKYMCLSGDMT